MTTEFWATETSETEFLVIDKAIGYAYATFETKQAALEWIIKSGRPYFFKILELYSATVVWG